MIRIVDATSEDVLSLLAKRTLKFDENTRLVVSEIIEDVRTRGDEALLDNARKFDSQVLRGLKAEAEVSEPPQALVEGHDRILAFHQEQLRVLSTGWTKQGRGFQWSMPETSVGQRITPLASAGVYVPGGKAAYPSSVLMNSLPAVAAGVERIVVTTPSRPDGSLHPAIGQAARLAGVEAVYKVGGAAAIAALALGTESIPRVDKIVGPGNRFVNEAKRQLWGTVGLDGYAGPSEVAVLADDQANPTWAAADLLTQIEHADDNAAFLICLNRTKLDQILDEAERLLLGSAREDIMRQALKNESLAIISRDLSQACEIVNAIAPEHLTLMVEEPERVSDRIHNAGCILMGNYTPESAADWIIGPSHTLPTSGAARFGGPVNVLDFLKVQSFSSLTKDELTRLGPSIQAFGEMEGFPMHAEAARLRLAE